MLQAEPLDDKILLFKTRIIFNMKISMVWSAYEPPA